MIYILYSKIKMDSIKQFICNLPPYQLSPYEKDHIIIYIDLDTYAIKKYMVKNWKSFIYVDINNKKPNHILNLFSICETNSRDVINDIIKVFHETIRQCFEKNNDSITENHITEYLHTNLQTNLEILQYKKSKYIR